MPRNRYLLLAIATLLIAQHLTLAWKSHNSSFLETSFLCWTAVAYLVWQKRSRFVVESGPIGTGLGGLLIGWVVWRYSQLTGYDSFLRFAPLLTAWGLGLLVFRRFDWRLCWRELLILAFLSLPSTSLLGMVDLSPVTADFSGSLLWYLGYPITQNGVKLTFPNGSVDVYSGCSGIQLIWQLLTLTLLFTILFPLPRMYKMCNFLLPLAAILIGFIVNGLRVVLMAILFTQKNQAAFDYWHLGDGSWIFSVVAVLLLGGLCYGLQEWTEQRIQSENPG